MHLLRLLTTSTTAKPRLLCLAIHRNSYTTANYRRKEPPLNGGIFSNNVLYSPIGHDAEVQVGSAHWQREDLLSPRGSLNYIDRLRKDKPDEYKKWLEEEQLRIRNSEGVSPPSEMETTAITDLNWQVELLRHIDGIENVLGYSFKSYEDLLVLLPRFPRAMRKYKALNLERASTLALLGESVVNLAMRDANMWRKFDQTVFRNRGYTIGLLSFFIYQKNFEASILNSHRRLCKDFFGWEYDRLSFVSPGIFGALFRDGGMDAVKRVLNHTKFLDVPGNDHLGNNMLRLHKTGLNASIILLISSLCGKVGTNHIKKCIHVRCHESWHTEVYNRPGVAQFIEACKFTSSSGNLSLAEVLDDGPGGEAAESSSALRYQDFLGNSYREGGLALVRDMLNRHDPGFRCPSYPQELQKTMTQYDKFAKEAFWRLP